MVEKIKIDWDKVFTEDRQRQDEENRQAREKAKNEIYHCDGCGKEAVWGPTWGWWGSYNQWESDPYSLIYFCSDECWLRAMDARGVPMEQQLESLLRALKDAITEQRTGYSKLRLQFEDDFSWLND